MTVEYSEALARDALVMLKGLEKHIMPGGAMKVEITPDGCQLVEVSSQTITGATRTHQFRSDGKRVVYCGTYNSNIYEGQECTYR